MSTLFIRDNHYHIRVYRKSRRRTIPISLGIHINEKNAHKNALKLQQEIDLVEKAKRRNLLLGVATKEEENILFSEGFDQYIQHLIRKKPLTSQSTKKIYTLVKTHWIDANKDLPINCYEHQDYLRLIRYYDKQKLSHNAQACYVRTLLAVFNYFVSLNWIKRETVATFDRITPVKKKANPIPLDKLKQFISYLDKRDLELSLLTQFLLITGLRISDALRIKWSNITDVIEFTNSKAHKEEKLPVIKPMELLLPEIKKLNNGEKLFRWKNKDGLSTIWTTVNEEKKTDYNLHRLRKTCATYLINKGVHPEYVRQYLCHSDYEITDDSYVNVAKENLRKEINKKANFQL